MFFELIQLFPEKDCHKEKKKACTDVVLETFQRNELLSVKSPQGKWVILFSWLWSSPLFTANCAFLYFLMSNVSLLMLSFCFFLNPVPLKRGGSPLFRLHVLGAKCVYKVFICFSCPWYIWWHHCMLLYDLDNAKPAVKKGESKQACLL